MSAAFSVHPAELVAPPVLPEGAGGNAVRLGGPHTYRKTVATLLAAGGLSARTIADQLGHSGISMTQDVYMGRRAVDQAAASALDTCSTDPTAIRSRV